MNTRNYYVPLDIATDHGPCMAFLWAAIARYYPTDGTAAWPTRQQLADELQVTPRTVSRWIGQAEEAGILKRTNRPGRQSMLQLRLGGEAWAPGIWRGIEWLFIPPGIWNLSESIPTRALLAYCHDKDRARWSTVRRALNMGKTTLYETRNSARDAGLLTWTGQPATFTVTVTDARQECTKRPPEGTPDRYERTPEITHTPPLKDTNGCSCGRDTPPAYVSNEPPPEGSERTLDRSEPGHSVLIHRENHKTNSGFSGSEVSSAGSNEITIPGAVCLLLKQKRKSRRQNFYDQVLRAQQKYDHTVIQAALEQFDRQLRDGGAQVTSPWGYFETILKSKARDMAFEVRLKRQTEYERQRRQKKNREIKERESERRQDPEAFWRFVERSARLKARRARFESTPTDAEQEEAIQDAMDKFDMERPPERPKASVA